MNALLLSYNGGGRRVKKNMTEENTLLKGIISRHGELKERVLELKAQVDNLTDIERTSSKIFLDYVFARGISDDVNEFLCMFKTGKKVRYQNFIIRNMVEHTIEYLYLCKNPALISEYFGEKIVVDISSVTRTNAAQEYKKIGQDRYESKRAKIKQMSNDIGEGQTTNKIPCLYDIFCIVSENCHNSYFQEIIDEYSEVEVKNSLFCLQFVSLVLIKFMRLEENTKRG